MSYALLLYWVPGTGPADDTPELEAEFDRWDSVTAEMRDAGVLLSNEAIEPPTSAFTLGAGIDGLQDGAATDDERTLFAYYLIDVHNRADAERWARKLPHLDYGWVEIRPTM